MHKRLSYRCLYKRFIQIGLSLSYFSISTIQNIVLERDINRKRKEESIYKYDDMI